MGLFGIKTGQDKATPRNGLQKKIGSAEPRILRLAWLGLKTADLMAETVFIERTLGLKYLDEGNSQAAHHVRFDCGLELELVTGGTTWASRPKPRGGQPDLPLVPSFQVDDIGSVATRLHELEVPLTQVFEQGWAASFLFFDPERNLWQVSENRVEAAAGTIQTTRLGSLWLAVEDLTVQLTFYRDVLGLPLTDEDTRPRPITPAAEEQQQQENAEETGFSAAGPESPDQINQATRVAWDEKGYERPAHPPTGAVFFRDGVRLALSPGGRKLEGGAERVWGKDTAFMPGLLTNDLDGYAARLKNTGLEVTGPFFYYHNQANRDPRQTTPSRAIRFTDPEGNRWQVFE